MHKNKIIDCITFFDNNFMFELRYNILVDKVDYFIVCESMLILSKVVFVFVLSFARF